MLFTYFKIHGKNKLKRCGVKTVFGEMRKFFLIIYIYTQFVCKKIIIRLWSSILKEVQ